MSLEKRVETLEHEMKILKNEIESTLLEIQNQILIHYYPTLRAENPSLPKGVSPFSDAPFAEKREEIQGQDPESLLKTKEISLNEIKGKPKPAPMLRTEQPTPPKAESATWPEATISPAGLTYLAKWVNDAVEKLGKEHTQKMVESHAGAEYCTPEVKDLLLQFILLSDVKNSPKQVETKEVMDALLKLNKVLDQVARAGEVSYTSGCH